MHSVVVHIAPVQVLAVQKLEGRGPTRSLAGFEPFELVADVQTISAWEIGSGGAASPHRRIIVRSREKHHKMCLIDGIPDVVTAGSISRNSQFALRKVRTLSAAHDKSQQSKSEER